MSPVEMPEPVRGRWEGWDTRFYYILAGVLVVEVVVWAAAGQWGYVTPPAIFAACVLFYPRLLRGREQSGFRRGRLDVLTSFADLTRQGMPAEVWLRFEQMRELIYLGVYVVCEQCQHAVPRSEAIHPAHAEDCPMHPANIADAQ